MYLWPHISTPLAQNSQSTWRGFDIGPWNINFIIIDEDATKIILFLVHYQYWILFLFELKNESGNFQPTALGTSSGARIVPATGPRASNVARPGSTPAAWRSWRERRNRVNRTSQNRFRARWLQLCGLSRPLAAAHRLTRPKIQRIKSNWVRIFLNWDNWMLTHQKLLELLV